MSTPARRKKGLWCFIAVSAAIGAVDVLLPANTVVLSYLTIPVAAAAVLADVRATAIVTFASFAVAAVASAVHAYTWSVWLTHMGPVLVAGVVSATLARWLGSVQRELRGSRQNYQRLAENAADVVYYADSDRIVQWVSPTVERVLGWHPDELVGHRMADLVHPDDAAATEEVRKRMYAGEQVAQPVAGFVVRMRRKDGQYLWVSSHATAPDPSDPDQQLLVGSLTDIQELMTAHEQVAESARALAASEDRYRLLTENSSDAVFATTADGTFTYISPNVRNLLGFTADEIIGRSPIDFIHPDDAVPLGEKMAMVAQGKSMTLRARYRKSDGGYRWISVLVHPVLDAAGVLTARMGSWRDADREVAVEQALESERARLRADLDSQIEPHITMHAVRDDAGRIVDYVYDDANPAALAYLGMTMDEFRGTRLMSMYPSAAATVMRDMYSHTVETGQPLIENNYTYPNEMYAGDIRHYDLRGAKFGDGLALSWADVTERALLAEQVAQSAERFRLLAENAADVVVTVRDDRIDWISPSVEPTFGTPASEWIGRTAADFIHPDDMPAFLETAAHLTPGQSRVIRLRITSPAGAQHWIEAHAKPYLDTSGAPIGLIASFRIVDDVVATELELDNRARFDALTGLANRAEVLAHLERSIGQSARSGTHACVLFCDVDHFKDINDNYGHAGGDQVLRVLAERVSGIVRGDDQVGRLGGDELLIVLFGLHSLSDAVAVAEKIRLAASGPIDLGERGHVTATLSIGAALMRVGESIDDLIARADHALYDSKRSGRNQVVAVA